MGTFLLHDFQFYLPGQNTLNSVIHQLGGDVALFQSLQHRGNLRFKIIAAKNIISGQHCSHSSLAFARCYSEHMVTSMRWFCFSSVCAICCTSWAVMLSTIWQ